MPLENAEPLPEPWLRGTLSDCARVQRALLHSLQMAQEDTAKWCGGLDDRELHRGRSTYPPSLFSCGTSPVAWIASAAMRRELR